MKKWVIEVETSDEFEPWDCQMCPAELAPLDEDPVCMLGNGKECPLKESKEGQLREALTLATKVIVDYYEEKPVNICEYCVSEELCEKCFCYTGKSQDAILFSLYMD